MARTDHSIKADKRGRHVITFPANSRELIPPTNYEERLAWIRSSFDSFITVVKEKDEIRQFCNKA